MATPLVISVPFSVHERPHLRRVLDGIEAFARFEGNWRLFLPNYFRLTPLLLMEGKSRRSFAGQISGVPTHGHIAPLQRQNIATTLINYSGPDSEWANRVCIDYQQAARLAIDHFRSEGIEQLAFFGSTHPERHDHQRYRAAMDLLCQKIHPTILIYSEPAPGSDWSDFRGMAKQWQRWVATLPEGTGVVCADDECAARIYLSAELAGRTVGRDLFVLGAGNEETFCEAMAPTLSSLEFDYFSLGHEAARMLGESMTGQRTEPEKRTLEEMALVVRKSSRPLARHHPKVEHAVQVIREGIGRGITVEEVARSVQLNRRQLLRLFRQYLGHAPAAELQQARIEAALRRLRFGSESLATIANDCGFSDQAHMARAIRKATGMTPGQYRLAGARPHGLKQPPMAR